MLAEATEPIPQQAIRSRKSVAGVKHARAFWLDPRTEAGLTEYVTLLARTLPGRVDADRAFRHLLKAGRAELRRIYARRGLNEAEVLAQSKRVKPKRAMPELDKHVPRVDP